MKRIVLVLLVLCLGAAVLVANGEDEAGGDAMAGPEVMEGYSSASAAGVNVQWMVDGDMLRVQMSAMTTGWVAVGFDPSKQMADANIIIGYVEDGEVMLRDDYGTGNVRHGADTENGGTDDLSDVSGSESGGATVISFSIPLDSGDSMDKALTAGSTYKIILAHGPDGADDYGTYHGSRGSVEEEL